MVARIEKILLAIILSITALCLFKGWHVFWFLTDDAYISFRYVSNSILGHGYVWNPSPFQPVEGYTNFLWIVLLDLTWRLTSVEPPDSSTMYSFFFALGSLILAMAMVVRLPLTKPYRPYRLVFVVLALALILSNRTFLAWTSSGLETAMFNFFVVLWCYCVFYPQAKEVTWAVKLTFAATGIALTRPDGLLYFFATAGILSIIWYREKVVRTARWFLGSTPLFFIFAHLLWRKSFYGEWLPNTYYAKSQGFWPEAGIRYALSFILEYALWLVLILVVIVLVKHRRSFVAVVSDFCKAMLGKLENKRSIPSPTVQMIRLAAVMTLIGHFLYYTLKQGGDHFEYRVYSHFVVILSVFLIWLLNRTNWKVWLVFGFSGLYLGLSLFLPWVHWYHTHDLLDRVDTIKMKVAVTDHVPSYLQWYTRMFDHLQFWLIERSVCMRHQEHKVFYFEQISRYFTREYGMTFYDNNFPIYKMNSVGMPAWTMPRINILDQLGLNDYIIARNYFDPGDWKQMAHSRRTPKGYLACLSINVKLTGWGTLEILPRNVPLTAEDIIQCEKEWIKKVEEADENYHRQVWIVEDYLKLQAWDLLRKDTLMLSFNRHLRFCSKDFVVYVQRALLREVTGDKVGALQDYNTAIKLESEYVEAYLGRGRYYFWQGDLIAATRDYNTALQLDPNNALVHYLLGFLYQEQGYVQLAWSEYERALNLYPEFPEVYNNRGILKKQQGDLEGALQDFNTAVYYDPELPDPYCNRAALSVQKGNYESALQDLEQALEEAAFFWVSHDQTKAYIEQIKQMQAKQTQPID